MARMCKVCGLDDDLKQAVDKQILDNTTPRLVAQYLTNRGVNITAPSIDRHKKNCLGIESIPQTGKTMSDDNSNEFEPIDVQAVLDDAKGRLYFDDLQTAMDNGVLVSSILLSDILANQLALLKISQDKYIKGTGHYPKDQFRDLQIIVGLQGNVSEAYRKRYYIQKKREAGLIE